MGERTILSEQVGNWGTGNNFEDLCRSYNRSKIHFEFSWIFPWNVRDISRIRNTFDSCLSICGFFSSNKLRVSIYIFPSFVQHLVVMFQEMFQFCRVFVAFILLRLYCIFKAFSEDNSCRSNTYCKYLQELICKTIAIFFHL